MNTIIPFCAIILQALQFTFTVSKHKCTPSIIIIVVVIICLAFLLQRSNARFLLLHKTIQLYDSIHALVDL